MVKLPFGVLGLKIRVASATGAALFAVFVLLADALPEGWSPFLWLMFLLVGGGLFWRVRRTDEDGETDLTHLFTAMLPFYLLLPGVVWIMIAGEDGPGPSWGSLRLFGEYWTGASLYLLFLACVLLYNLLRMNLQRSLTPRR